MRIVPRYSPVVRPAGLAEIFKDVGVVAAEGVTLSQAPPVAEAVNPSVELVLVIFNVWVATPDDDEDAASEILAAEAASCGPILSVTGTNCMPAMVPGAEISTAP